MHDWTIQMVAVDSMLDFVWEENIRIKKHTFIVHIKHMLE